jgi:hypothetical protein
MKKYTQQDLVALRNSPANEFLSDLDAVNLLRRYEPTEHLVLTPNEAQVLYRALNAYDPDTGEHEAVTVLTRRVAALT